MPLTRNFSLIFTSVPDSVPVPGRHLTIQDMPIDLSECPDQGIITRNLYSSLDPYMRMMLVAPGTKHYRAPFTLGQPMYSGGIAEVLESRDDRFKKGHMIRCRLPIQQYSCLDAEWLAGTKMEVLPDSQNLNFNIAAYLGPLGMPGQTAYSSIFEIGKPKVDETIFISAASGAVGQLVGQICKKKGLHVIGSVGSQEKLDLIVNELGFDGGFLYKEEEVSSALTRLCPDGIDIYYDNVGGEQLEAAIGHMNKNGRIVVCGMISQYNKPPAEQYGVKNLFQFVGRSLTMRGFLVGDAEFQPKWGVQHERDMMEWLEKDELKVIMSEMVGIELAADAFAGMLEGRNRGKALLRMWPEVGEQTTHEFQMVNMR